MFTPLQKILSKAIYKLGIQREIEAALICEKYRKLAPRFIHTQALKHTFPKFFKGRTLTIGVENSAWAEMVLSPKADLIENINRSIGRKSVSIIKTQVVEKILT